jgi:hypothetical protein
MMNRLVGKIGSLVIGLAVLSFAISMIVGLFLKTTFASCFASIFIAIGFIPFVCSIYAINNKDEEKAMGISGIAFAVIYAVIIFMVYFAECTTVRMNSSLSEEALSLISYGYTGSLFFNYDLLGYAFMALSTFLISFTVHPRNKGDKVFKLMLGLHGLFFFSGLIVPLFPVFTKGKSQILGTILLEIWCAYFLPVCILGFKYFNHTENDTPNKRLI